MACMHWCLTVWHSVARYMMVYAMTGRIMGVLLLLGVSALRCDAMELHRKVDGLS